MVEKGPIDKLTIKGFKSLKDVDLELGKLNVLIGPNGAGKSNLVSYFNMLQEMVEERLQNWVAARGGSDRILSYGIKETEQIASRIDFGENGYGFVLRPDAYGKLFFEDERLHYSHGYDDQGIPIGSGHYEAKLQSEIVSGEWRRSDYCYGSISSWKVFHFHDTSDTAPVKRLRELHDNEHLRRDAANLAPYLYRLRQDDQRTYSLIRKIVRLAIPFFGDFDLRPTRRQAKVDELDIMLRWRKDNSDYPLLPTQLSDGSIRFICLVTALLQPDPPSTIIIDEPELGLHPYAIHLLGALLRSASKRMQVIVATQSTLLLDEFDVDDLIVVERENGGSVFKRLEEKDFKEWLKDFSVGELWSKNVLGGGIP